MKRTLPLVVLLGLSLATAHAQVVPELFVTADRCMACHNSLVTATGQDISIGVDWRSSMMANSARDPYWQAAIRREVLEHPTAQAAIENECSACHMPMARFQANTAGQQGQVFAHLPVTRQTLPASLLAADGVSCAMCHQIQADRFGTKESFTAGFRVDTTTATGQRLAFGPYEVDAGRVTLMQSASLFRPTRATHVQQSELCATCHTLYTHALSPDGKVVGELPEQVPYLEWRHSSYYETRSCQSCHMPVVDGETQISGVMGVPRQEVSRHVFRGGNFFVPRLLNHDRVELGVKALPQELESTSERTTRHLETASARLTIEEVELADQQLRVDVAIDNLAGHKLPSAYPSRRTWVHLKVRDAADTIVFESGRFSVDGSIEGNDNDADATRYEPHYELIESSDQVQVYESILAGPDGAVTTVLLTAVSYAKDNRLLPQGFDKATAEEDIAVHGRAAGDQSFTGGGDRLTYAIAVAGDGPYTVEAELLYQPIGYRWAQNLQQQKAAEIDRFVAAFNQLAGGSAVVLAHSAVTASSD
jgi:hypothetical protein